MALGSDVKWITEYVDMQWGTLENGFVSERARFKIGPLGGGVDVILGLHFMMRERVELSIHPVPSICLQDSGTNLFSKQKGVELEKRALEEQDRTRLAILARLSELEESKVMEELDKRMREEFVD